MIGRNEGSDQANDDLEHFCRFYRASVRRLITFLVCSGFGIADSADAVQETMIEVLPPKLATLSNPYGWCRSVAYRKACNTAGRCRELPVASVERAGSPLVDPNFEFEKLEQDSDFLFWLSRLPGERQRIVLAWTYDGATPTEIARELGMDPTTVRSTLRNARASLRRLRGQDSGGL